MTENEYINLTDLTRLRIMLVILGDLAAGGNKNIDEDERKMVGQIVGKWIRRIQPKIHTRETP